MSIILIFLLIFSFGFLYNYHFLRMRNAIYLFSFSGTLGLSIYLVLIYTFSSFFGIYKSSLISLFLLFLFSIYLVLKDKQILSKLQFVLSKIELLKIFLFLIPIVFFTYLSALNNGILDFKFHLSAANTFLKLDKFPSGYFNSPTLMIPYHFGFDLLSASLSSLSKADVIHVFKVIVILSSLFTFLGAYSISFFLSEEFGFKKKSFIFPVLFFYFLGNLVFFDSIFSFNENPFKTICSRGLHGSIFNDIGSSAIFLPTLTVGFPIFLFLFFLTSLYLKEDKNFKLLFTIFSLGLAIFQCAEYILFVLLLSLLISFMFELKNYKYLFLIVVFMLIIILNKIAFNFLSSNYSYIPGFLDITVNPYFPFFTAFGRFGNLSEFRKISIFSWDLFQEIGLHFLFLIFVLFKLVKLKSYLSNVLIAFFLISFITPFLLYIKSSPSDSLRILHPGLDVLALVFIIFVSNFKLRNILIVFILPSIFKLLLSSIFTNAVYLNLKYIDYVSSSVEGFVQNKNCNVFCEDVKLGVNFMKSLSLFNESEFKASNFINNNSYGISNNQLPFGLIGLPAYVPKAGAISRGRTFLTVLDTFDPSLIKEMKIGWLYVDNDTAKYINESKLDYFIKEGFVKKIAKLKDELNFSESVLYKFNENYTNLQDKQYFWTLTKYVIDEPFPINNTLYVFNSEDEANNYIKKILLRDPSYSKSKFFTNAVSKDLIYRYAGANRLKVELR